jgi:hypothetical protein
MDEEDEKDLPDTWFCDVCASKKNPASVPEPYGPFGGLFANLAKSNPQAYSLPASVRNYFENVKTASDGQYDEVVSKPVK